MGGGPAGLAVAQHVAEAGLVCATDPVPGGHVAQQLQLWVDEFVAMGLSGPLQSQPRGREPRGRRRAARYWRRGTVFLYSYIILTPVKGIWVEQHERMTPSSGRNRTAHLPRRASSWGWLRPWALWRTSRRKKTGNKAEWEAALQLQPSTPNQLVVRCSLTSSEPLTNILEKNMLVLTRGKHQIKKFPPVYITQLLYLHSCNRVMVSIFYTGSCTVYLIAIVTE